MTSFSGGSSDGARWINSAAIVPDDGNSSTGDVVRPRRIGMGGQGPHKRCSSGTIRPAETLTPVPTGFPDRVRLASIDGASFNLNAVYTVGFTVDAHTHLASVTDGTVTFDLDTSGTERLYVVDMLHVTCVSDPELNIEDGRVDADEILVQNSGQLDVGSDGWLLAFGDFNIDGGLFRVLAGGEFSPIGGAEDTIIVQNGGHLSIP